jgi:peptide subunit release factor 1 (eRF1)
MIIKYISLLINIANTLKIFKYKYMDPLSKLSEADLALEQFRLKKLIKSLAQERTGGTSVVSLYIPPKRIISDITNRLGQQYAEADSIKDKGNRTSVQEAIASARDRTIY